MIATGEDDQCACNLASHIPHGGQPSRDCDWLAVRRYDMSGNRAIRTVEAAVELSSQRLAAFNIKTKLEDRSTNQLDRGSRHDAREGGGDKELAIITGEDRDLLGQAIQDDVAEIFINGE